ncbi:hypothetical protein H6G89_25235 [Oscillatoria sp. FACHB-1407]|uniref:glycoside hydrolase family 108 protein n=1 Tax=Oscillatoria sp. FACHB-1407 TaxID=2692847 RepID=UPI001689514B|nr:glycosyl hydrolase 108 family protein [Oscillatoria sp. FACHB-1407]MBD2464312.1 hypothetical protein [Oscillatoria sp. FACHB-1407]
MNLQTIAKGQTIYPISAIRNNRALIQSVQMSLNQMGFTVGRADGVWGQGTDTAFQAFVQRYGFKPGEISPRVARFIVDSVGVTVPPTPTTNPAPPRPNPTPTPQPPRPNPTPQPSGDIFGEALKFSLRWEGGYVNHPNDIGGETNKGVTASTYASYRRSKGLSNQSVRYITDAEVYEIYRDMYWRPANCDLKTRALAIVHFDTAVNFGVGGSTIFLQEVLGLRADGGYGPITREAVSRANNAATARRYCQARIDYRYQRVKQNPSQNDFLQGWLNRDEALLRYISNMA